MNLTTATHVTQSALAAVSAELALVSRNIGGVNSPGFSQKTANVVTTADGGVEVASVTNAQNQAVFSNVLSATAASATQSALSGGPDYLGDNRRRTGLGYVSSGEAHRSDRCASAI